MSGWVATPGTNQTTALAAFSGSPAATGIQFTLSGKNHSNVTGTAEVTGTWASLFGINAGAVVTTIGTPDDFDYARTTAATASAAMGPLELRDNGDALLLTLAAQVATASTTAARTTQSGTSQAVPAASQPASTNIRFRLTVVQSTGNSSSASTVVLIGNPNITITYQLPAWADSTYESISHGLAGPLPQFFAERAQPTAAIPTDDPWNTIAHGLAGPVTVFADDGIASISVTPSGWWNDSPRIRTHQRTLGVHQPPIDQDALQGNLFVMQPLDDEFETVRWSPATRIRPTPHDRTELLGGLFRMQPLDDEFRSVRWSPAARVRPVQQDRTEPLGGLFVMQPLDDEFRTIRWSPIIRVRPVQNDRNEPQGNLFVMQPLDDPFQVVWHGFFRRPQPVVDRDGSIQSTPAVVGQPIDDPWNTISHGLAGPITIFSDEAIASTVVVTPIFGDDLLVTRTRTSLANFRAFLQSTHPDDSYALGIVFGDAEWDVPLVSAMSIFGPSTDNNTAGNLFTMQPPDDPFEIVRWSGIIRPRLAPAELSPVQPTLFVVTTMDDEYRTVRWSPVARPRPTPHDYDSDRVTPIPFDDPNWVLKWGSLVRARVALQLQGQQFDSTMPVATAAAATSATIYIFDLGGNNFLNLGDGLKWRIW